jgi:serine/threonine protein kinase/Tol biopolymer transport system component
VIDMPAQIGPYRMDREIGRGGMGVVYLARDERLDRDVAIKALPPELAADTDLLARFEREGRTLAQVSHPNIAGIYGIEEQDGQQYLILEYVEGETLADRLDRGPLPVHDALEIAIEIASGVEAAHEAGVIHRDLKPDNIKLTPEGKVKVLDFGLARAEEATGSSTGIAQGPTVASPRSPTTPGAILGTAPYMSPEQARGRRLDKRSDIWSFGVILYEMLTGVSPFVGESVSDSLGAILHKDVDLHRLPSGASPLLRHVIDRCLQRDRNQRLRDIGDARLELMAIASGKSDDGIGATTAPPSRRTLIIGVTAVMLASVLTGLGVWRFTRPELPRVMHLALPQPQDRTWFNSYAVDTFAISRDGQSIVYRAISNADGDGKYVLVLRHQEQAEPITLADLGSTVLQPFFSPDGQSIGYVTADEIRAVSVTGGAPRRICSRIGLPGAPRGLVWRLDGLVIFGTDGGGLFSVPADGGTPRSLTALADGERGHAWPESVPGTEIVLFTIQRSDSVRLAWYALDTGRQETLLENAQSARFLEPGFLLYVRDEELRADTFDPVRLRLGSNPVTFEERPLVIRLSAWAAFAIGQDGTLVYSPYQSTPSGRTIVWVDRQGTESPTSFGPGSYGHITISPSGSRVAFEQFDHNEFSVWMGDTQAETKTRFISESGFNPVWSADGKQIIWCGLEADTLNRRAADGTGSLESFKVRGMLRAVSPDGQFVVGRQGQDTFWDLWLAPTDGEPKPFIVEPGYQSDCAFSSDGKWVAHRSISGGGSELFVCPYPDVAKGKVRVPGDGSKSRPIWSRDGSELFFIRNDKQLMAAPVTTTPTLSIGNPKMIYAGLDVHLLVGTAYAPMPDGQRFLVIKEDPAFVTPRPEIDVVVNWIEVLKAKMSG